MSASHYELDPTLPRGNTHTPGSILGMERELFEAKAEIIRLQQENAKQQEEVRDLRRTLNNMYR